jgi:hypothetical protein
VGRAKFKNVVPSINLRAIVQEEKRRRAGTAAALLSILRHQRGGVVTSSAIRRQLAEYYGQALSKACTWSEMWRAVRGCRGKISWSIAGGRRQRHFRGVELVKARGFARIIRNVNRRLAADGLPEEPTAIRTPTSMYWRGSAETGDYQVTLRDPENTVLQPGLLVKGGGIWKQTVDHSTTMLTADTKNEDGTRGRRRRFVPYLARLQLYLQTARMPAEDRQVLDLVVAGHTVRDIAAELGLTRWKVQSTIERHQDAAAIPGPGPGC